MKKINKLHPIQSRLLTLLKENIDDPLTIREIQNLIGASSTSVVSHHIKQLEKKGYLKRNPDHPRDYQILKGGPEKKIVYLNLYGLAHCNPKGTILDGRVIERLPVSSRLLSFPSSKAFLVKAKGDSMTPKIHPGDYVIVKKTNNVQNGSIVVCVNDGEALIKKIQKEKDKIILTSLNSKYAPFLARDDFRIEGEVKGIITFNLN